MKLTETSLRRPVTVVMCTLALVIFGLLALKAMGVQRIPDVDFPLVTVTTVMKGASATVMDHDVADVIEEKLSSISGIESMTSSSYEGRSVTTVQFDLGRDVDAAAADVRDKVNLALSDLPDEAETPVVQKFTIGDDALVGHMVMLHGCRIEDRGFVGLGAIAMNKAVIASDAMLAAGAMLTEGKVMGPRELWGGRPARLMRELDDMAIMGMRMGVAHYVENAHAHRAAIAEASQG